MENQTELIKTYCAHCHAHCGVVCEVDNGILKRVMPDPDHPNGMICIKGEAAPELVYHPDRLKYPLKRTRPKSSPDPGWERISWDEALDAIANRLNNIKKKFGPEAVVFSRSAVAGSPLGDCILWWFRLPHAFGTPNTLATTHICQWARDNCSIYTYGIGIGQPDFEDSSCILIWGHNPHVTRPPYVKAIRQARDRGAKLIVVDPRRTPMASEADIWLQVRPGTDGALALSMIHVLLDERLYDEEFVRCWTNGPLLVRGDTGKFLSPRDVNLEGDPKKFIIWNSKKGELNIFDPISSLGSTMNAALTGVYNVELRNGRTVECKTAFQLLSELVLNYPPENLQDVIWVEANKIRDAARMLATIKPACYSTYVGIEEHTDTAQTNRAICILYALTGNFDAPGGNVFFPRVPTNPVSGDELLPGEKAKIRLGQAEKPLGPGPTAKSIQAYDFYKAILAGRPYPIKALISFGGDVLLSNGDTGYGAKALRQLEFYVHVDLFENPSSRFADILLPASSCWEAEFVRPTFEQGLATSTYLQLRKEVIPPLHESWPDMKIMFELAKRLGLGDKFWNGDLESAFDYQLAPSGITVKDLRNKPEGIYLSLPIRYKKYADEDPQAGRIKGFNTLTKKIEIYSQTFLEHGYDPLPHYKEPELSPYSRSDLFERYPFVLTCSKLLHFCHTQHRNIPMLRRHVPYPYVEINPQRAEELGIADGEWVILETPQGGVKLKAKFNDGIDKRVVCTQHGWWQACSALDLPGFDPFSSQGANINLVTSNNLIDPLSGSVPHRSYLCKLRKAE